MAAARPNTTTVNIKGVKTASWENAKAAAAKRAETLGDWISRAADQMARMEKGDRIIPPGPSANPLPAPAPATPDLGQVAALLHAMGIAGVPVQKRVGRQVNGLLHQQLAGAVPPPALLALAAPSEADKPLISGED